MESAREWISSTFATYTVRKSFVDDQNQEQYQEERGRRARELRERAIYFHLDELEEKYLCCVCGASGEARESEEHIYDTFSTIILPPEEEIAQAASPAEHTEGRREEDLVAEVKPMEVQHLLYKIRHAVLNKESRTKRQAVSIHKDKGLLMIEEDEVDAFSNYFRRPVQGYLCLTCHSSAKLRMNMLTEQIESILFKATHPFLKNLSKLELSALYSSGQISQALLDDINASKKALHSSDASPILPESASHHSSVFLPTECITTIRTYVVCGVCKNRKCSYFLRPSVLFLCQFCCARDRYYRSEALCINDEPFPAEVARLLLSLSKHYEKLHQQLTLRQLPAVSVAKTSLFENQESVFHCQGNLCASSTEQKIVVCGEKGLADKDQTLDLFSANHTSLFSNASPLDTRSQAKDLDHLLN